MTALVVDDSSIARIHLRHVLQKLNLDVYEAGDGKQALELLRSGLQADVILLDWSMPGMDGDEVLSALRADRRFDSIRVVMVTTESDVGAVTRALDHGADEYVMKPFTPQIIIDKMRMLQAREITRTLSRQAGR
jgi:two-component system chemotaxis response regulator CheY